MEKVNGFKHKLQEMIEKSLKERQEWEHKRAEAEARVKGLDTKLAAYQTTLRDYEIEASGGEITSEELLLDHTRFNNKKVSDCCELVLTETGGEAAVAEVTRTLRIERKLAANYKVAYSQVYAAMRNDPRFVRTEPGKFRLARTMELQT